MRELENLVRRLAALYPQETIIGRDHRGRAGAAGDRCRRRRAARPTRRCRPRSSAILQRYFAGFDDELPPPGLYQRILREVEYPLLSAALAATRGNQIKAADLLGLNRNTLRKKIRDLGHPGVSAPAADGLTAAAASSPACVARRHAAELSQFGNIVV